MPLPAPAVSLVADAYTQLTEVYPYLGVTELSPTDETPRGDGRVSVARLA